MIFRRSNRHTPKMMFDIAWHYHDPNSGELVVYNNGKVSVKHIHIAISTDMGLFFANLENILAPRTGSLFALAMLKGNANEQFSGTIKEVVIKTANEKFVFVPDGNKFRRK